MRRAHILSASFFALRLLLAAEEILILCCLDVPPASSPAGPKSRGNWHVEQPYSTLYEYLQSGSRQQPNHQVAQSDAARDFVHFHSPRGGDVWLLLPARQGHVMIVKTVQS